MGKKKTVHIISHSHWDREWYLPFECHRMRLVELIDGVMELFENDPEYRHFFLDGQTIVLEDYLAVKPKERERLRAHVESGRFQIGPWYVLQDEFLTSGESNIRNLLVGIQMAKEFGAVSRIGYFPDAFGNAGQMPQILKQAGMEAVVYGRGVKPVGFNNDVQTGEYESVFSEMIWESPDGSSLPGILFYHWYNNAMELPTEEEAAREYWDRELELAERYAGTDQLLFMNGCDHQPPQADISKAIALAEKLHPEIAFVHSDLETYIKAVKAELPDLISHIRGELTSQETDGCVTLVNTASSRVDLKTRNRRCELALEKRAEPLSVFAALLGKPYPAEMLLYSWKTLMQNHPHDSICCCSVDEVGREMKTRYEKSMQVADALSADALEYLSGKISTDRRTDSAGSRWPFLVFNMDGWEKSGVTEITLTVDRDDSPDLAAAYDAMRERTIPGLRVTDAHGKPVDAHIEDLRAGFGYTLPRDRFRQRYMARRVKVVFEAERVPALGYQIYYLEEAGGKPERGSLVTGERRMENDNIRVQIEDDGSFTITDKRNGTVFPRVGWLEDTGDIGNEYVYVQSADKKTVTTKGVPAAIRLAEDEPYRAVYEITHCMEIPVSADETLELERNRMVPLFERKAGRSGETAEVTVVTRLSLTKSAKGVKAETTIQNTAGDHRLRVMVPTGLRTDWHRADSLFEVVKRNNRHGAQWKNPSGCEHEQAFVSMEDDRAGILVCNVGLYEYEVLPDDNTIAVTLLRAVGEMGDWGVFPTPEAQLRGTCTVTYGIVPFSPGEAPDIYHEAYQFQTGLSAVQTDIHAGTEAFDHGMLSWEGNALNLTGWKLAEDRNGVVARFVNNSEAGSELLIRRGEWFDRIRKSNVVEERLEEIPEHGGIYRIRLAPCEILTIRLERSRNHE